MAPSEESGWLLYISLAAKCGGGGGDGDGEPYRVVGFVAVLLVACVVTSLLHWASSGGPAWGRYWWTRRGLGIGNAIPGPRGLPVIGSMRLMTGLAYRKLAAAVFMASAICHAITARCAAEAATCLGEKRCVDATRRSACQYAPYGANPMARWNMQPVRGLLDRPVSERWAGQQLPRHVWVGGQSVTTTWVSPRENAMSRRQAHVLPASAASFRCARPVMSHMLPITGSPRGPGMALPMPKPLLVHQYLPHAGPPGDAQCRSDVTMQATSKTATKPTTR